MGWYGTETMGDKAILDGILSVLSIFDIQSIRLGSLFPFYTERTIYEEKNVFCEGRKGIDIKVFDLKVETEVNENVSVTNMIIFGGGPLMDLEELFLVRYAFKLASKLKIPIIVMGAGIGPLKDKLYVGLVKEILQYADLLILRDELSRVELLNKYNNDFNAVVLPDPAIISIEEYKKKHLRSEENYRVINLRDYMESVYSVRLINRREEWMSFIRKIAGETEQLYFTPMHNFFIGEDDRYCLAELLAGQEIHNLHVVDKPINLHDLYRMIMNAQGCIGMRYHSVVMQTILNGNNIIIDYTGINKGKICGFINDYDKAEILKNRRYIVESNESIDAEKYAQLLSEQNNRYEYDYMNVKNKYIDVMKRVLK